MQNSPTPKGERPRHRKALEEWEVDFTGKEATKFLPLILPTNNTALFLDDAGGARTGMLLPRTTK